MKEIDAFISIFGNITILDAAELILAIIFLYKVYKRVKKYFDDKAKEAATKVEAEKNRDAKIAELSDKLKQMEEDTKRRECNKTRDRLLQNYRYYINPETNPDHSWTKMESEAFWELFRDYEDAGGDGYMHTVVQPAMQLLTVTNPTDK